MSEISEKVLGNIRKNGIKPTCKIYFVAREILAWVFYMTILFLGAFIFSGILELLLGKSVEDLSLKMILSGILNEVPQHWFLILIFFLFAGLYINRYIKSSYRFQKRIILAGEILGVFLLGIIFYFFEAGPLAYELLSK